jgi:predicted RNase H-like HicB family nuclease
VKLVEWSDEDNCYVGSCPGLLYGGCHGDSELDVLRELRDIIEETIRLYQADYKSLPAPTSGRDFVNKLQDIA